MCPGQPVGKKAFCAEHCVLAERLNYPTDIKKFLKFEKSNMSPEDCGMQTKTYGVSEDTFYITDKPRHGWC